MKPNILSAFFVGSALVATAAQADTFYQNYEAPGVQNTTAGFSLVGVETFDGRTSGASFTTNFGLGSAISAQYSATQINNADKYGGAGGVGQYAVAFSNTPYTLKFTTDPVDFPNGVNYFGYWLSALDLGNQVTFYRAGVQVGAFSPADLLASPVGSNPAYFGNPNANFLGQNSAQPYVFVNFYDTTGSFDEVRFSENPSVGGYESDNHTVGYYTSIGGVPEPMTWTMLIAGFGMVGVAARRRTAATA